MLPQYAASPGSRAGGALLLFLLGAVWGLPALVLGGLLVVSQVACPSSRHVTAKEGVRFELRENWASKVANEACICGGCEVLLKKAYVSDGWTGDVVGGGTLLCAGGSVHMRVHIREHGLDRERQTDELWGSTKAGKCVLSTDVGGILGRQLWPCLTCACMRRNTCSLIMR